MGGERERERKIAMLPCLVPCDSRAPPFPLTADSVFPPEVGQAAVFEETESLIDSVLDGYNVCVFAYGQTGSGKTWTMTGGAGEENAGLTPRSMSTLFNRIAEMSRTEDVKVTSYFLELYNEGLVDLYFKLDNPRNDGPKLDIKMGELVRGR